MGFIGLHYSQVSLSFMMILLKPSGIQLHFPVRKRTPRVPVSCLDIHPNKKSRVSARNADDSGVPHRDLRLKEAWCNPNSPHGSQITDRKNEHLRTQVSAREEVVSCWPMDLEVSKHTFPVLA